MKVLLDTCICIAVMRGNARAISRLRSHVPGDCAVSTVTIYELFVGVEKCSQPALERAKVQRFLSPICIVSFDHAAAIRAGQLRAEMERNGNACGPYDILLAAHALALNLPIATHNTDEFSRITALQVQDWI